MTPQSLLKATCTALSRKANIFAFDEKNQHAVLSSKQLYTSDDLCYDKSILSFLSKYGLNCEPLDEHHAVVFEDDSAFQLIISFHKSPTNGRCHLFLEIGMQR